MPYLLQARVIILEYAHDALVPLVSLFVQRPAGTAVGSETSGPICTKLG